MDRVSDEGRPRESGTLLQSVMENALARAPGPEHGGGHAVLGGRYVLDKRVARGGSGEVWRAMDRRLVEQRAPNPYVAVKLHTLAEEGAGAWDSLYREWSCLQGIRHASIITHRDIGREGAQVYLVMDYLVGPTLAGMMRDRTGRRIPVDLARSWLDQIGQALAHAHDHQIIHADLNPSNIKLVDGHRAIVIDFGLAYHPAKFGQLPSDSLTPAYASPEMFAGRLPSTSDDVFSYACIAYEMLSGVHPFHRLPAPQALRLGAALKPVPGLDRRSWRALARGLALHRHERAHSIRELHRHLAPPARSWSRAFLTQDP